jgi:imidazolonepropionase-like amidohydrolase
VHLEFSASPLPLREYRAEQPAERLMRAVGNAHRLLLSGVTTARDCGSSRILLALGRRPDLSPVPLPRLLLSGPPVTVFGGHLHMMGGEAESEAEIVAMIAALVSDGASAIKAMASGGGMTPGTHPERATYDLARLRLIAGEARRRGLPSAAHALATESIRRSAAAGFDSVEHCAFFERTADDRMERRFDEEVAREVAASGVSVMAGLSTAYRPIEQIERDGPHDEDEAFMLRQAGLLLENFRQMALLGVRFVCGSDAGVKHTPFEETWFEIALMARSGLGSAAALRAATARAADALLLGNEVGRIAVGYSADLIAVRGDPLADVEALATVDFVMRAGAIVRRPGELTPGLLPNAWAG